VPVSDLARTRYAVRFGDLTFAERVIDAFKSLGLDSAPIGHCPELFLPTRVVEIVDQRDWHVMRRFCVDADTASALFEKTVEDLQRLDITTFEQKLLTQT
jgi:hypothetical protein